MQTLNLSKQLIDAIGSNLLDAHPDPRTLITKISREMSLDTISAKRLLREVVTDLNRSLFPSISKMELLVTRRCNLACRYCFEGNTLRQGDLSQESAEQAIELLLDYSKDEEELYLVFFGGEPLLHFDRIRTTAAYAESKASTLGKKIAFRITSNGVMLTEEMADFFAKHDIRVLLSIDGLAENHDRFRVNPKGEGTFKHSLKALRLLKKQQPWVGIKMTVSPQSAGQLCSDVQGLHELGVNQFIIGHATGIDWPTQAQDELCKQWQLLRQWYDNTNPKGFRITEFEKEEQTESYFGCQAGRQSITVDVDGTISSCAKVLSLEKNDPMPLGSIEYGITHLRNREQLITCAKLQAHWAKTGITDPHQGGCFASNFESTGNLFQPCLFSHHLQNRIRQAQQSAA